MVSYNRVVLAGNLTRDPELRFTNDGIPVCSFGLAVNRRRSKSDEVDFFDITAWRELGETIANYKTKGDPILVEGRLQYRQWEAQDGSKRSKVDVVADNVQFLGRGGDGNATRAGSTPVGDSALGDGEPYIGTTKQSGSGGGSRGGSGGRRQPQQEDFDDNFDDIPFRAVFPEPVVLQVL